MQPASVPNARRQATRDNKVLNHTITNSVENLRHFYCNFFLAIVVISQSGSFSNEKYRSVTTNIVPLRQMFRKITTFYIR